MAASSDGIVITTLYNMPITVWNAEGKTVWSGEIEGEKKINVQKGNYVVSNEDGSIKTIVK